MSHTNYRRDKVRPRPKNTLIVHEPKLGVGQYLMELAMPDGVTLDMGATNSEAVIEATARKAKAVILRAS